MSGLKIRNINLMLGCLVALLWAGTRAAPRSLDYTVGPWRKIASLPSGKFIHRSVIVNGRLYVFGGAYPATFYTRILDDGSLEPWKTAAPLAVNYPSAAVQGNRIYIVAGSREGEKLQNVVFYGDIQPDGNITDWVSTLEALKVIDFDTVLPARGAPFKGKEKVSALQSYLRDVLGQGTELLNKGLSVEDAARRVDLTAHKKDFPEIQGPGVNVDAIRRLQTQLVEDPPWEP